MSLHLPDPRARVGSTPTAAPNIAFGTLPPLQAALRDGAHARFDEGPFWQRLSDYAALTEAEFLSHDFQVRQAQSNATAAAAERLLAFVARHAGEAFASDVRAGLIAAPMAVQLTPYILSLIDWGAPYTCPIRRQFLPIASSLVPDHPGVRLDSLDEQGDTKAPGLVHRYFDRALFLPQATCPVYCRFCTRSYAIGGDTDTVTKLKLGASPKSWEEAFAYLRATPTVEDVILSGGDSYNLHPKILTAIGEQLLGIDHIRRVRIATKGLAVNPGRILTDPRWTDAVVGFVEKGRRLGKQIVIHTHVNTPEEMTWVTRDAMRVLFSAGVIVRNQSVLLRGVNDSIYRMALLIKRLGYLQIQPYYVYQHDLVRGVDDLRTSLATCLAIEHGVRGITAGFNTPTFVVDTPGGGGKRPASTFDHYDPEVGISVYTAPAVKPGRAFFYYDPLHALSEPTARRWLDPEWAQAARCSALAAARAGARAVRGAAEAPPHLHG